MRLTAKEIQMLSKIKNSFYEDLKIEFLYHSNHLEGSTFSKDNLEKLIYERQVEGIHAYDDVIETKNSIDLFDKVIVDSSLELDKFMLLDWHRILKKGSVDEEIHNTGVWKRYENRLRGVDLHLALPSEVDSMIFNLLMDWKELESPRTLKDIANFHYRFERIHPYQDGNGRIGRFVMLKQCLETGVDLIAVDEEYDKEYKQALYHAQKTDDSQMLVDVFERCQQRLDEKLSRYQNLIQNVREEIQEQEYQEEHTLKI